MEELETKDSKSWLQKLKDESWEAELIISTVAIFGSLQLFKMIDWGTNLVINNLHPNQYMIGFGILFFGLVSIGILTTMFIIHFLLRAYWVGLVGLNSVFPDYGLSDSAYSEIYTEKMLSILPKLEKTINDVDELSSVIFSAAFFMILTYGYLLFFGIVYLLIFNKLSGVIDQRILLLPLIILAVLSILQMLSTILANLKLFKQNEKLQLWYFHITKWVYILLLGPLYKYILQISMSFGSNFKKKKSLIGLVVVFIIVGFVITNFKVEDSRLRYLITQDFYFDKTMAYSGYYASRNENPDFLIAPQIDSDIVDSKLIQLFIPIYNYEKKLIRDLDGKFSVDDNLTKKENRIKRRQWYLDRYNQYVEVMHNGDLLATEFIKYELPETGQFGIVSYVNLEGEKTGKNSLKVIKRFEDTPSEWEIPFHYIGD